MENALLAQVSHLTLPDMSGGGGDDATRGFKWPPEFVCSMPATAPAILWTSPSLKVMTGGAS